MSEPPAIETVVRCADLGATLAFLTQHCAFGVESIRPADDPRVAVLVRGAIRLRLERDAPSAPAPSIPSPTGLVVSRASETPSHEGRAGMRYRDLIPRRLGGRVIGSCITIERGGPVTDWVHFHRVEWQLIYCRKGEVTVVYEDQGPPFTMRAGDCVLQPPGIRHRVLESSAGLEVVEFASPAEHETLADAALALPTPESCPDREFSGQRFTRHVAESAAWSAPDASGFEARDLGLARASAGRVSARVLRPSRAPPPAERSHEGELLALVVLRGVVTLANAGRDATRLESGDAVSIPRDLPFTLRDASPDLELLEVVAPAAG